MEVGRVVVVAVDLEVEDGCRKQKRTGARKGGRMAIWVATSCKKV
jgi:hypothetical protein